MDGEFVWRANRSAWSAIWKRYVIRGIRDFRQTTFASRKAFAALTIRVARAISLNNDGFKEARFCPLQTDLHRRSRAFCNTFAPDLSLCPALRSFYLQFATDRYSACRGSVALGLTTQNPETRVRSRFAGWSLYYHGGHSWTVSGGCDRGADALRRRSTGGICHGARFVRPRCTSAPSTQSGASA